MKLEEIFATHETRMREAAASRTAQPSPTQAPDEATLAARRRAAAQVSEKLVEIRKGWDASTEVLSKHGFGSAAEFIPWADAQDVHRAAVLHVSRNPPGVIRVMTGFASQFNLSAESDLDTGVLVFGARDNRSNATTILASFPAAELTPANAEGVLAAFVRWFLARS